MSTQTPAPGPAEHLKTLRQQVRQRLLDWMFHRRGTPIGLFASTILAHGPWGAPARERYAAYRRLRWVRIFSPEESQPNLAQRYNWGDYWVRYELTKALGGLGYSVTDRAPDIAIHLFGQPTPLPSRACKIVWIYSHPERVTPGLLRQYDRILCLSPSFTDKIRSLGFQAEWMPAATSRTPVAGAVRYDIVFVGNAVKGTGRQILLDLGDTEFNLKVWGRNWDGIIPPRFIGGDYYDYTDLGRLYSSALITLSDHQPAMRQEGFVNARVFDILACGGFCISDANPGITEIFGDSVPQYRSPAELRELVRFYITHPDARLACMAAGRAIAARHTWPDRAAQLMRGIDPARPASRWQRRGA